MKGGLTGKIGGVNGAFTSGFNGKRYKIYLDRTSQGMAPKKINREKHKLQPLLRLSVFKILVERKVF